MSSIWDGDDTIAGIVWILTSIGSVNWGLVEFANYDVVAELGTALGSTGVPTALYAAIALAGVITLADHLGAYDVTDFSEQIGGDD